MNQTWKTVQAALLAGMFLFALGLAGCEDDEAASTNSANARSQAELQALADQAAADSGLSGFTSITAANADTVGDDGMNASGESGETATPSIFLSLSPDAVESLDPAEQLRTAVAAVGLAGRALGMIAPPGSNRATTSGDINTTLSCTGVNVVVAAGSPNSVTLTGTVSVTTPDSADGTGSYHISIQNLNMAFTSCLAGGNTVWGELRWNTDDTLTFTSTTFSYNFDEYMDGGLVLQDTGTLERWNYTLAASMLGSWTINSDGTQAVNITVTVTVNDVTCVATVDNATDLFFRNFTYTCS